jgi:excisionase family DNA binding protein
MVRQHHPSSHNEDLVDLFLRLSPQERSKEFLCTRDAARWCCLSRRSIVDWIDDGSLEAIRVGRKYFVSVASLRRMVMDVR